MAYLVLDNLGRKKRNVHDDKMENIIGHLSKLAIHHQMDAKTGEDRWLLATKAAEEEEEE